MKSSTKKKAAKLIARKVLQQDIPEWPPGCMGFFFQPQRPQVASNTNRKQT